MRLFIPLLLTAMLAGCFGVPEGTADVGDFVTVDWVAKDPETGEIIRQGNSLRFAVGSGTSGLGALVEYSVIGKAVNTPYTFYSDDPSRGFEAMFTPDRISEIPVEQEVPRAAYSQQFGEPTVGDMQDLGNDIALEVAAVTSDMVTIRYVIEGTVTLDDPDYGMAQHVRVDGDMVVIEYTIEHETTFLVRPNIPPRFEGMPTGTYKAIGDDGDKLVFRYTRILDPLMIDVPLEFEITINSVQKAPAVALPEGSYGGRSSPQLLS